MDKDKSYSVKPEHIERALKGKTRGFTFKAHRGNKLSCVQIPEFGIFSSRIAELIRRQFRYTCVGGIPKAVVRLVPITPRRIERVRSAWRSTMGKYVNVCPYCNSEIFKELKRGRNVCEQCNTVFDN